MSEESVREYLERRWAQLQNRLSAAEASVRQLKSEIAAIERACVALEPPANPIDEYLASGRYLAPMSVTEALTPEGRTIMGISEGQIYSSPEGDVVKFSIKQYIVAALWQKEEYRTHGASATEIRKYIYDVFNKDIERTSLSPQLSRLKEENVVEYIASAGLTIHDGKWRLIAAKNGAPAD